MAGEGDSPLIEFYGTECVHCRHMDPLLKRLEEETGLKVRKVEVWHNNENLNYMKSLDRGFCGGVPFFFNIKTGRWICGNTSYEKLKNWALGL